MTQKAHPEEDITKGLFTNELGASTNLYASIDENKPNDDDYIKSTTAPHDAVYVARLSGIEDPHSSDLQALRYRYRKSQAGGNTISMLIQLRQGYVDEGDQGTLIAEWNQPAIGYEPVTRSRQLEAAEADAITDYGDLYVRVVFDEAA